MIAQPGGFLAKPGTTGTQILTLFDGKAASTKNGCMIHGYDNSDISTVCYKKNIQYANMFQKQHSQGKQDT